ncbi:MAG: hypothetical protein QNJ17_11310 [Desulfocapsaceae bacterium]|nr:hypothetical protein [Desulfocapsaceae bacterium]
MKTSNNDTEKDIANNIKTVSYTSDADGNQKPVSGSYWQPVNVVNHQAWREIEKQIENSKEKIRAGRVSCLHYYMTANQMSVGLLASYTGQSSLLVRLHLLPFIFTRLRRETLQIYADLFKIEVEDLIEGILKPPLYQQGENGKVQGNRNID